MKVVFVDEKDDKFSGEMVRYPLTFNQWVKSLRERKPYITKILVYDVKPCHRYFCDQGCKPGQGCKKDYQEDDINIYIVYQQVYKKKDKEKFLLEQKNNINGE